MVTVFQDFLGDFYIKFIDMQKNVQEQGIILSVGREKALIVTLTQLLHTINFMADTVNVSMQTATGIIFLRQNPSCLKLYEALYILGARRARLYIKARNSLETKVYHSKNVFRAK